MNEEKSMRKEQFLRETERQLRMAQVDTSLEADNLIHASWNGKPLCTVDANGTVRFSPDNIRGVDEDRQLQTVRQTVAQVKEYLQITAPPCFLYFTGDASSIRQYILRKYADYVVFTRNLW